MLFAVVVLCAAGSVRAKTPFKLSGDDVVVFAGGANMLYLQQAGHLEAILTKAAAPAKARFRDLSWDCLLYTSPSPRDATLSRMAAKGW